MPRTLAFVCTPSDTCSQRFTSVEHVSCSDEIFFRGNLSPSYGRNVKGRLPRKEARQRCSSCVAPRRCKLLSLIGLQAGSHRTKQSSPSDGDRCLPWHRNCQ